MYNDDYIMLFDENGQPYIEHASLAGIKNAITSRVSSGVSKLKGMKRPGAKYYARIGDPGNYRYFYSKEEYDRYLQADTAVKQAVKEAQRNPSRQNQLRVQQLMQKRDSYGSGDNPTQRNIKNSIQSAKNRITSMRNDLRNRAANAAENAKNKVGIGARSSYNKEQSEADEISKKYDDTFNRMRAAVKRGHTAEAEHLQRQLAAMEPSRQKEVSEARRAKDIYDNSLAGKADRVASKAKNAAANIYDKLDDIPENMKNKGRELSENIKNTVGIGLKDKATKERKEADQYNARYNTMLEGYRNAFNTGDKAAEEHLGRRLREYGNDRDREEREAQEAERAYNNSWAGKASNMINRARGSVAAGRDKVEDTIKSIKDGNINLKNMSVSQINKMADDLKSAPAKAREYIDSGRDAIQNTTGIGLRETVNTLKQKLSDASQVRDKILAEHSAAVDAGDTERAAGLQRAFKRIDDAVSEYQEQVAEATKNYNNSIAGRRNNQPEPKSIPLHGTSTANDTTQVSEARIRQLLDKFNAHEKLSTKEMNIVMSFLGGMFNS